MTNLLKPVCDDQDLPKENLYEALMFQRWRYLDYEKSDVIPMNMLILHELDHVDLKALTLALDTMVDRHESLRTLFTKKNDVVYQQICDSNQFSSNLEFVDMSQQPDKQKRLLKINNEMINYRFDFAKEQAFKCKCIKLEQNKYILAFLIDHMISDAYSKAIIKNELNTLYSAFATGKKNPLPSLKAQLKDYTKFHHQHYRGSQKAKHEAYFKWLFSDLPPKLEIEPGLIVLPESEAALDETTPEGRYRFLMPEGLIEKAKTLLAEHKITFFNFMLSGFCLLLSRISTQKEFFVDSPANTRNTDFDSVIGWLVGPLVSRVEIDEKISFSDLLFQCREIISTGLGHIYFNTYSDLLDVKWNEVVSTQLNIVNGLNNPIPAVLPNLGHDAMKNFVFDFTFNIQVHEDGIVIDCLYKPELIKNSQIPTLCEYFNTLIEQAVDRKDQPLKHLK